MPCITDRLVTELLLTNRCIIESFSDRIVHSINIRSCITDREFSSDRTSHDQCHASLTEARLVTEHRTANAMHHGKRCLVTEHLATNAMHHGSRCLVTEHLTTNAMHDGWRCLVTENLAANAMHHG